MRIPRWDHYKQAKKIDSVRPASTRNVRSILRRIVVQLRASLLGSSFTIFAHETINTVEEATSKAMMRVSRVVFIAIPPSVLICIHYSTSAWKWKKHPTDVQSVGCRISAYRLNIIRKHSRNKRTGSRIGRIENRTLTFIDAVFDSPLNAVSRPCGYGCGVGEVGN